MSTHVMIDLETMDSSSTAAVMSIGAVKFDPNVGCVIDTFYVGVTLESAMAAGLTVSANTIEWWMHPLRDSARPGLLAPERVGLWEALDGFAQWIGSESLPVWGNGATFDNVILRHAYERTGQQCPWKFWDDRCYRTFKSLAPEIKIKRSGTHHNALDDALSQAAHLQAIVDHLGLKL